jgi:enamine deaminase RidA (YjgF/YER057c/UK114 family)
MVAAPPEFGDHPKVINGCSDLMTEVFGDAGRHARSAFGVSSLPFRTPVEIELVAEVE